MDPETKCWWEPKRHTLWQLHLCSNGWLEHPCKQQTRLTGFCINANTPTCDFWIACAQHSNTHTHTPCVAALCASDRPRASFFKSPLKTRGGSWSSTGVCYEKTRTIKGKRRWRGGRGDKRQIWTTLPPSLSSLKSRISLKWISTTSTLLL